MVLTHVELIDKLLACNNPERNAVGRWIPCWGSRSCHRWQGLQISDHRRSSCAGHSTVDPPPHSDSVTILWLPTEDRMTDDASLVVCCGVDL